MVLRERWNKSKLERYRRRQRKKSWAVTWILAMVQQTKLVRVLKEVMLILILILMLMVGVSPAPKSPSLSGAFLASIGFF